jgi:hypothetical protein
MASTSALKATPLLLSEQRFPATRKMLLRLGDILDLFFNFRVTEHFRLEPMSAFLLMQDGKLHGSLYSIRVHIHCMQKSPSHNKTILGQYRHRILPKDPLHETQERIRGNLRNA